jgi:bacterioferritin-associated ferredoxin
LPIEYDQLSFAQPFSATTTFSTLPQPMIVCVCHRVSDQTIARCARSGMAFDDIQLELGVATQCGQCESCARSLWSECTPHQSVVHLQLHPAALPAQAAAA